MADNKNFDANDDLNKLGKDADNFGKDAEQLLEDELAAARAKVKEILEAVEAKYAELKAGVEKVATAVKTEVVKDATAVKNEVEKDATAIKNEVEKDAAVVKAEAEKLANEGLELVKKIIEGLEKAGHRVLVDLLSTIETLRHYWLVEEAFKLEEKVRLALVEFVTKLEQFTFEELPEDVRINLGLLKAYLAAPKCTAEELAMVNRLIAAINEAAGYQLIAPATYSYKQHAAVAQTNDQYTAQALNEFKGRILALVPGLTLNVLFTAKAAA